MSYTIAIPNGLITFAETDFNCPVCTVHHDGERYDKAFEKKSLIYRKCFACKTMLGLTTDIKGDIQVWPKDSESKQAYSQIKLRKWK